jgi:hypothetical protein
MNEDWLLKLLLGQTNTGAMGAGFTGAAPVNMSAIMNTLQNVAPVMGVMNGAANTVANAAAPAADAASGFSKALPFVVGLGLSAIDTVMSFTEAGKAEDARKAAEREATKQAAEKLRLLEQNNYEALQAPTEAYNKAFMANTAAAANAVDALSQDSRTLIGGVQGVQNATVDANAKQQEQLADRIYNMDVMKAGAATAQNDKLAQFAGEQAQGAQIAAMAAEKAQIAQEQAGLQGIGNLITQGAGMVGTYGKMANPGDNLSGLSSANGNAFLPKKSAGGVDPKMLMALMQLYGNKQLG